MIQKRRGPGRNRGHAHAGELSAWESYRSRAMSAVNAAMVELNNYADTTDVPEWGAVIAADLLDAALSALDGAQ